MTNAFKEYPCRINLIMKQIAFTDLKFTITIVATVMLFSVTNFMNPSKYYPGNTYNQK